MSLFHDYSVTREVSGLWVNEARYLLRLVGVRSSLLSGETAGSTGLWVALAATTMACLQIQSMWWDEGLQWWLNSRWPGMLHLQLMTEVFGSLRMLIGRFYRSQRSAFLAFPPYSDIPPILRLEILNLQIEDVAKKLEGFQLRATYPGTRVKACQAPLRSSIACDLTSSTTATTTTRRKQEVYMDFNSNGSLAVNHLATATMRMKTMMENGESGLGC